ncbi:MAG TPA: hypothetical protein PKL15_16470 [Saprospiraceae bacterium]|nr:hypothetical protein [Saprospiraceae bacterium]
MDTQSPVPIDRVEINKAILDLFEGCLGSREPFHRKLDLFVIPDTLAHSVMDATGVDVFNHWVCIDNYGIIHTLEQHGNPLSEARRGQIAIVKEDFVKYLDVFLEPDEIVLSGVTKRTNLPLLQFIKILEDKKFVLKEVRTITSTKKQKVSRLVLHTMYKTKVSK